MLHQGELYDLFENVPSGTGGETSESLWSQVSGSVAGFLANYAVWTNEGAPGLPGLLVDLQTAREQLAGAGAETGEVDALIQTHGAVSDQAARYGGTWDLLARWVGSVQAFLGQQVSTQTALVESGTAGLDAWPPLPGRRRTSGQRLGLPLLPLALTAGIAVAAIAALAWTVNTWQDLRARTATVKDLAQRVASGQLTADQASKLLPSTGSGFFAGLGTAGLLVAVALGWFLLSGRVRG